MGFFLAERHTEKKERKKGEEKRRGSQESGRSETDREREGVRSQNP